MQHVIVVDPDSTRLQRICDTNTRVQILGVHCRRQTVRRRVTNANSLLFGLELLNGADGAEDFFLHDLHVLIDVGEDGGLNEVAFRTVAAASNLQLGTLLLAMVDVRHDAIILQLRDLRTLEGLGVEGVANLVLLGAGLEALNEVVVDVFLDQDTGTGAAALAVVKVDAEVDPRDGVVDVCVLEDDIGGFSASELLVCVRELKRVDIKLTQARA